MKGLLIFLAGVALALAVEVAAGYGVVTSGMIPAGADQGPMPLEGWAAGASLRATLNADSPTGANPVKLTDANLISGIALYGQHCAICHGTAKGKAAPSPIAVGEYPAPPQLATDGVEDDPEGWTVWKITHGLRWTGMPGWQHSLSEEQIWTLALFLKHMDKLPPGPQAAWQQLK